MGEVSLSTWANLAEIVGACSIITGLIFGWFQIRQYRVQQRDIVAMNLAQTFYNRDLARALTLLQNMPDGIRLDEVRAMGAEYEQACLTVCTSFETMGLLIYKRIAPLDLVLDLAGGIVSVMCNKLRNWLNDLRAEQQQPSFGEWFEWLGDRALEKKTAKQPAHIAHRDWKP
ncbi:MAG: hypothetical protein V7754_10710 [Halioglobus sp.]